MKYLRYIALFISVLLIITIGSAARTGLLKLSYSRFYCIGGHYVVYCVCLLTSIIEFCSLWPAGWCNYRFHSKLSRKFIESTRIQLCTSEWEAPTNANKLRFRSVAFYLSTNSIILCYTEPCNSYKLLFYFLIFQLNISVLFNVRATRTQTWLIVNAFRGTWHRPL